MVRVATGPRFLPRAQLQALIDLLAEDGRRVIGPTPVDGAVVYDEVRRPEDLPTGLRDEQGPGSYRLVETGSPRVFDVTVGMTSWKRYTFPPVVPLIRASREGDDLSLEPASDPQELLAFLGVRACELAALRVQDRVLTGGTFIDEDYLARRQSSVVVAAQCTRAGKTCFCTSMGTGPEVGEGADLTLTELDDGFLVASGSPMGDDLLERLTTEPADESRRAAAH